MWEECAMRLDTEWIWMIYISEDLVIRAREDMQAQRI